MNNIDYDEQVSYSFYYSILIIENLTKSEISSSDTKQQKQSSSSSTPGASSSSLSSTPGALSSSSSSENSAPKSFARRDLLRKIEKDVQQRWDEAKVFEADVIDNNKDTFFATFPYPYMNGPLHLGHAFTITKAEFACGYQRLRGKNVLFPFGFHCTGMPIQAAAFKLRREIELFGNPPKFPAEEDEDSNTQSSSTNNASAPDKKHASSKSKTAKKVGRAKYQWEILQQSGISNDLIPNFVDPHYWLGYFPPLGEKDLRSFGLSCDWRRSFITTSANPFYDSFIRWQFETLRERNHLAFGKRPTVFSMLDKQACADHERASGEGVGPQEYTLIKLRVIRNENDQGALPGKLAEIEKANPENKRPVYLVAATLRPETMFGQTNCFVLPEGEYGAFEMKDGKEIFICSERSAKNMSCQGLVNSNIDDETNIGKYTCILSGIMGTDLIGLPLSAPLAKYPVVYCLPLLTISMGKGTGVVTSVPSDAPDDYAALRDLQVKDKLREKFNVGENMVLPFEVVPIIDIPDYGDRAAVFVCERDKIQSQNDKEKLQKAKEEVYNKGFYQGIMLVGEEFGVKGMRVEIAKPIVRKCMLDLNLADKYFEPESCVMSRSGEECTVAFLDQWYIKYGEEEWKSMVRNHISNPQSFSAFTPAATKAFHDTLDWLKEWGCSRNFGLGTLLPWDEKYVIESLSDSTIYMAYYTISHLIQVHDKDHTGYIGEKDGGKIGIKPEDFTKSAWDYIFLQRDDIASDCKISSDALNTLRKSFEYWYPMSLRVSGKDLIQNHLTMALYNHVAIWPKRPDLWPQSYFTNGHVMVNGEKMSKSLGNFITIDKAYSGDEVNLKGIMIGWTADATRIALADAGDGMDDANFTSATADQAILRLTTEIELFTSLMNENLRKGIETRNFHDDVFWIRINEAIELTSKAYDEMRYRDALKYAFFEFCNQRDAYRDICNRLKIPLHYETMIRYIEVQTIILSPICPHFCEYVWHDILKNNTFACKSSWPTIISPPSSTEIATNPQNQTAKTLLSIDSYLKDLIRDTRGLLERNAASRQKKKLPIEIVKEIKIFVGAAFPEWRQNLMQRLASLIDQDKKLDIDAAKKEVTTFVQTLNLSKKQTNEAIGVGVQKIKDFGIIGPAAFETALSFDEVSVLNEHIKYISVALEIERITVESAEGSNDEYARLAEPGNPKVSIVS